MRAVLGLDIGTSSTKALLARFDGTVLAEVSRRHDVDRPEQGLVEMDSAVWWEEFTALTRSLLDRVPDVEVQAVGVSGIGPCALLTDVDGAPLGPAILYGIDTRATAEIDSLTAEFGADAILDRAGTLLSSQAVGPKLEWVHRHEPEVFAAAAGWYGSNSYVAAKLTGEYVIDHHTASQCDPLYETRLFPDREYTFKHALTHEVAYGSLLQDQRRTLHRRIVAALEGLAPDQGADHVERLAHHALRSEVWDKAVAYARQAGARAMSRSAHQEAVTWL